jgi:magnesium chelatase subunit D
MDLSTSITLSADAALAAALCAVDPAGLGGVALRAPSGPLRDTWLGLLKQSLPTGTPLLRVPHHASDAALLGGLDLAATLQAGRPVAQRGLLARADGGLLLLAMAERCSANVAAHLSAALDTQQVQLQRDGLSTCEPARFGLVALDEGNDDERLPATLLDRLAFQLSLAISTDPDGVPNWTADDIEEARKLLPQVQVPDAIVQALCGAALAWGVASLRAPLLALRATRAAAALAGAEEADDTHAALAARLVLAPRATRLPAPSEPAEAEAPPDEQPPPEPPAEEAPEPEDDTANAQPPDPKALEDQLIEAMQAALPPGLLAAMQAGQQRQARAKAVGSAGALQKHANRGRPVGTRRSEPRGGARLHILDTLRAAAPWQRLRKREVQREGQSDGRKRIEVRREDFHVVRHRQHRPTTTVFVVDASGSAALHRLAEAKGAVELLLAECYVRRDKVAVLAFRGAGAELLLPPTRSLARAKRALAALPGGGGTPLAAGIDAARELAQQVARSGDTAVTVFLTDGRANIARSGAPGRAQAMQDALQAGQAFALTGLDTMLIDTSPQPTDTARELAAALGATYVALPHAGAAGLSQAVLLAQPQA